MYFPPLTANSGAAERNLQHIAVAPREGRVSRNHANMLNPPFPMVAPREGRVSRNVTFRLKCPDGHAVAPREGRVSRNLRGCTGQPGRSCRAPRGGV